MQIFEDNEIVSSIYKRAISLMIGNDFAQKKNGKIQNTQKQDSEQTNHRRELLEVEQQAKQDKMIAAHGQSHFKTQVMSQFFAQVTKQVNTEFDDKEKLYNTILSIDKEAPSILEILSVRAASINRITPLVKALPWLAEELIKLVNKPQYRKRADVQVSDASLALSYIGLDNLKLVMPTFILKHWLPNSTAPYPLIKRKLWNDSLSIAMAASVLAKSKGIDQFTVFSAGMFSNIGNLAVTRCFIDTYSELYNTELRTAYDNKDKRLHDILVEFDASPELLLDQLNSRSSKVAADLVELMRFDRLQITEPVFDLAYSTDYNNMCDTAQLIAQAKAYVAFRSLAKEELINGDEAKQLLSAVKLTPKDIALLKKSDIDHIKLNFN